MVLQSADQTATKELFESFFPGFSQRDLLAMRTNVSSANYWAVANGAGVGVFPTYACALGGNRAARDRVSPTVRYLAFLPSRQRPHPAGCAA